jgi:hypothetical protein
MIVMWCNGYERQPNGTRNTLPRMEAHSCFTSFHGIKNNAQAYESESWRRMRVDGICSIHNTVLYRQGSPRDQVHELINIAYHIIPVIIVLTRLTLNEN